MRVVVLGAGVVGTTTAYYLQKAGHDAVVVDRADGAGRETSFANAGQISPGYSAPWAAPGIPMKALGWLAMRYRPLVIRLRADPRLVGWLTQILANSNEESYFRNKSRMVALAKYSRDILRTLRSETGLEYDNRALGTLQLFRTQKQLDHVGSDTRVLDHFGVKYDLLDREGCIDHEPALRMANAPFVGGLRLPGDETGDAYLFTQRVAAMATALGAVFRYNETIRFVRTSGTRVQGIDLGSELLSADAYVVALGSHSGTLLRPLGIRVPIYPVKGYSLTFPLLRGDAGPRSTVMDESYKVAITRLGDRVRVGGTAELAGFDSRLRRGRRETLEHSVRDLFPDAGDLASASFWTGLRPMTPDGTPIVGQTSFGNLWLNTGHGTLGWTMACGSAKLLSDLMSGVKADITISGLSVDRYARQTADDGRLRISQ